MTLIAAWKIFPEEDAYDDRGIVVISDSMLSANQSVITDGTSKLHRLFPQVKIPVGGCDDDWSEEFNRWKFHTYKAIGIFYSGSSLAFNETLSRTKGIIENLGLKAMYSQGDYGDYLHTAIVRRENAAHFGAGDSMHGGHYDPPPALNLDFIAKIISEELQNFYMSQPSGAFTFNGKIPCSVIIGMAGYCESTKHFRMFTVAPNGEIGGYFKEIPYPEILVSEVENEKMLLLGSDGEHDAIEAEIQSLVSVNTEKDHYHKIDLCRQAVVETIINTGRISGVGGAIRRAEVAKDFGFNFVSERWAPKEKIDFSKFAKFFSITKDRQ